MSILTLIRIAGPHLNEGYKVIAFLLNITSEDLQCIAHFMHYFYETQQM